MPSEFNDISKIMKTWRRQIENFPLIMMEIVHWFCRLKTNSKRPQIKEYSLLQYCKSLEHELLFDQYNWVLNFTSFSMLIRNCGWCKFRTNQYPNTSRVSLHDFDCVVQLFHWKLFNNFSTESLQEISNLEWGEDMRVGSEWF